MHSKRATVGHCTLGLVGYVDDQVLLFEYIKNFELALDVNIIYYVQEISPRD